MNKRIGRQTVALESKPKILSAFSVVGPKEGEGPLGSWFDRILKDDLNGKDTYEQAESSMLSMAIRESMKKANLEEEQIEYLFAGDLLNQLTASCFAARDLSVPFFGLYGACSTMTEALSLASMMIDGGYANYAVAATSSHFSAAERQFRFPLEFGSQRAPTSQWTVTGAGAMILGKSGKYPYVTYVTTGKIKDYGIVDAANMGTAMAPAAVDTIYQHLQDTGRSPKEYDLIVTGDLGKIGKQLVIDLLKEYGYDVNSNYIDCGEKIFDHEKQSTHSGGSGCGCSAAVSCGYIYKNLVEKKLKRVLLVSTGALLSNTSILQGESIPGIAHAVSIEMDNSD